MILPTKHLSIEKSLLWIGAEILSLLNEPKTVSRLWSDFRQRPSNNFDLPITTYEWFILALNFLYITNAVQLSGGRIYKSQP